MFKKLNKKGFTLAELLIVVAIIAVMVAISIPVFTTQLEKAREATDASNMRAAYAVAMTDVLTDGWKDDSRYTGTLGSNGDGTRTTYYDLSGNFVTTAPTTKYGKSSVTGIQGATPDFPASTTGLTVTFSGFGSCVNQVIKVDLTIDDNAVTGVTVSWA